MCKVRLQARRLAVSALTICLRVSTFATQEADFFHRAARYRGRLPPTARTRRPHKTAEPAQPVLWYTSCLPATPLSFRRADAMVYQMRLKRVWQPKDASGRRPSPRIPSRRSRQKSAYRLRWWSCRPWALSRSTQRRSSRTRCFTPTLNEC